MAQYGPSDFIFIFSSCASVSKDSGRAVAEFVAPTMDGAINLVLNTSTLTSGVGSLAECCAFDGSFARRVLTSVVLFVFQGVHSL